MELVISIISISLSVITLALLGVLIVIVNKAKNSASGGGATRVELESERETIISAISREMQSTNGLVLGQVSQTNELVLKNVKDITDMNEKQLKELKESLERGLEGVRLTVSTELIRVREDTEKQLDKMREVVDEKLTKTLNDRLTQSFNIVVERLESVYKNLGQIQELSSGMTDLRKMLSNIKTRGVFGEVSLENLLQDTLNPSQYEKQCNVTGRGQSLERVDFAIIMPGKDDQRVLLPVDVKFPQEDYTRLKDAADNGDETALKDAEKAFARAILEEGRRISDKYIRPPKTTDFAIMYLPTEGLYGEVLKNEELMQNLYRKHVVPSGPTTFTALLNALRMGFQSLQIQKESAKVFQTFKDVQKLLITFNDQLSKVKDNLLRAERGLDSVSENSNKIASKLAKIEFPDTLKLEETDSE